MAQNVKYYFALTIAMFLWGGSWVSGKILVDIAPPFTIGFFRFLIASTLFFCLVKSNGNSISRVFSKANIPVLVLLGLTGIFGYGILFLTGMRFTTAAQGSIIAGFNPTTISVFAHVIHHEKLERRWQYLGFAVSFLGILFVIGVQSVLDFNLEYLIGNLIILMAMILWGLYSSIGKHGMKKMSAIEINAGGAVFGTLLFGLGAIEEGFWNSVAILNQTFWVNVLFLGAFVTFIGFLFYFESIQNIGATRSGGFINLVPVFGTILSVLILQEVVYWTFLVGLGLVVLGITIINFPLTRDDKTEVVSIPPAGAL